MPKREHSNGIISVMLMKIDIKFLLTSIIFDRLASTIQVEWNECKAGSEKTVTKAGGLRECVSTNLITSHILISIWKESEGGRMNVTDGRCLFVSMQCMRCVRLTLTQTHDCIWDQTFFQIKWTMLAESNCIADVQSEEKYRTITDSIVNAAYNTYIISIYDNIISVNTKIWHESNHSCLSLHEPFYYRY